MSEQQNEAREAAVAKYLHIHSSEDGENADYHLCDQCGSHEVAFNAGYSAATADAAAEIERLRAALRAIRDMPEYDQDDCHRLRNKAGVALGKPETPEGEGE